MTKFHSGDDTDVDAATNYCVRCAVAVPRARELYAVCQRATRSWEGGGPNNFAVGMIAGIPYFFPTSFERSVEHLIGEDIVVSVPLPVCDRCWKQLDGGTSHTILSVVSQVLFTAGVVTLAYMLFAKMRGGGIFLIWPISVLACAVPPHFFAERIRSRWDERLKEYMRVVPQYDSLLGAFPDVELLTHPPTALMKTTPNHDCADLPWLNDYLRHSNVWSRRGVNRDNAQR